MKMSDQATAVIAPSPEAADTTPAKPEAFASKSPEEIALAKIEEFTSKTPNEIAVINAKSDRKRIVAALDAGALCCQPGENGYADTAPAVNLVNNSLYHGVYQLLLKDHQKQNGFPTAEYGTFAQFEKAAQSAGKEGVIKKNEHGFTITINDDGKMKPIRLFNVAQAVHPEAVREYAALAAQQKQDYLKQAKGENYREPKPRTEGAPLTCVSTKPDQYLGQYFAALSLNRGFKATPQQSAQFAENMKNAIFAKGQTGHINPYNLNVICNKASEFCKSFMREFSKTQEAGREPVPAPKVKRQRETESMGR
jgi:hypothetical protein